MPHWGVIVSFNEGVGAANQGGNDRHGTHCEDRLHIAIAAAYERTARSGPDGRPARHAAGHGLAAGG